MDDEALNLDFGVSALQMEEQGALFRAVDYTCNDLFGEQALSHKLKDSIEAIEANGRMAKITRIIIKNVGCVIGSVVEIEYFNPSDEPDLSVESEVDEYGDETEFFSVLGRHTSMTFDMCDGSFYKQESLSKLVIDEMGDYELEDLSLFDIVDEDSGDSSDEFAHFIQEEASTLTIDDYFIVNTVKLMLVNKF